MKYLLESKRIKRYFFWYMISYLLLLSFILFKTILQPFDWGNYVIGLCLFLLATGHFIYHYVLKNNVIGFEISEDELIVYVGGFLGEIKFKKVFTKGQYETINNPKVNFFTLNNKGLKNKYGVGDYVISSSFFKKDYKKVLNAIKKHSSDLPISPTSPNL